MEGWEKYLNKKVSVFYDDGKQVSKKIGKLTFIGNSFLFLKVSKNEIIIPIDRIIRIELEMKKDG
ncbi:MAG: hypothetical protein ACTSVW_00440 [Candidatus Njordarchaeales archaeon]